MEVPFLDAVSVLVEGHVFGAGLKRDAIDRVGRVRVAQTPQFTIDGAFRKDVVRPALLAATTEIGGAKILDLFQGLEVVRGRSCRERDDVVQHLKKPTLRACARPVRSGRGR